MEAHRPGAKRSEPDEVRLHWSMDEIHIEHCDSVIS